MYLQLFYNIDKIIGDITTYVGDLSHGIGEIFRNGGGVMARDDEDIDDNHEKYGHKSHSRDGSGDRHVGRTRNMENMEVTENLEHF